MKARAPLRRFFCENESGVSIEIRSARPDDAEALASLSGQLGYESSAERIGVRLRAIRSRSDDRVLVAERAAGIVGWIHVFGAARVESEPFAEIGGFVVDAGCRGSGIGAALLAAAERWALERGYEVMRVRSNVARADARRFYEKHRYRVAKEQTVFVKPLGAS